jgi:uncharacterized protein (DUF1330 family)
MAAYLVFIRETLRDAEAMAEYRTKGTAAAQKYPMDMIVPFGPAEILEGDPIVGAAIVRFENREAAMAFYKSPEYQEVTKLRLAISDYTTFIIEGR